MKKIIISFFLCIFCIFCISCISVPINKIIKLVPINEIIKIDKDDLLFYHTRDMYEMYEYKYFCPICMRKGIYKRSAGSIKINEDMVYKNQQNRYYRYILGYFNTHYHYYSCTLGHSWLVIWENNGKDRNNLIVRTKIIR